MSSFRGQMNEYSSIAIDRFDGKNLQCTAFFLSHCHKDHMTGLNNLSFMDCLSSRDDVFLYCSEITRLLLVADEEYKHLDDYIRVLDVGMPQPVMVPSNTICKDNYSLSVTLIPAGHCPGSVMFLFEGAEGICLYTGDFRWEINQASKMEAFKEDHRLKDIKSMYVDTTFCVPEAYHIPSRSECVEATVTLISDWLRHSPFHIVNMHCPARFGHEHLLMELAHKLDTKIHVPAWKVELYDQISELQGVFTSNPSEASIHACSKTRRWLSCLSSRDEKFQILCIRPSTMWFTMDKSKSNPRDLIVTPVSTRGIHRVCYSMHSSYSEIRDLVSYLQPRRVFPNVLPMSDASMEAVQARLNSFISHPHKLRVKLCSPEPEAQPLGVLKKLPSKQNCMPPAGGSANSDELIFSSQEESPQKTSKADHRQTSVCSTQSSRDIHQHILEDSDNIHSSGDPSCGSPLKSNSSYNGSLDKDSELNLFSEEEDEHYVEKSSSNAVETKETGCCVKEQEESLHLYMYISGDSEDSDDENGSKCTMDQKLEENDDKSVKWNTDNKQRILHLTTPSCAWSSVENVSCTEGKYDSESQCVKTSSQKYGSSLLNMNTKFDRSRGKSSEGNVAQKGDFLESGDTDVKNDVANNLKVCTKTKESLPHCGSNEHDDDEDNIIPSSQGSPSNNLKLMWTGKSTIKSQMYPCGEKSPDGNTNSNQHDNNSNSHEICPALNSTRENLSPGPGNPNCPSEELIQISSSSEDSQSTQSYESQLLWCVDERVTELNTAPDNDVEVLSDELISDSVSSMKDRPGCCSMSNTCMDGATGTAKQISLKAAQNTQETSEGVVQIKQLSLKRKPEAQHILQVCSLVPQENSGTGSKRESNKNICAADATELPFKRSETISNLKGSGTLNLLSANRASKDQLSMGQLPEQTLLKHEQFSSKSCHTYGESKLKGKRQAIGTEDTLQTCEKKTKTDSQFVWVDLTMDEEDTVVDLTSVSSSPT